MVQFVRGDRPTEAGPPWLLDRDELELFTGDDVVWASLETRPHPSRADGLPLWVGVLHRASAAD